MRRRRRLTLVVFPIIVALAVVGALLPSPQPAQAAPAFVRDVLTGSASSGTSLTTGNLAAAATAGDLLIAAISVATSTDPTIVTPTGYSKAGPTVVPTLGTNPASSALFYKIAGGGELNVAISWTGSFSAVIHLAEYSSVTGFLAQASVLDTSVLANAVSPASSNAPSVTGGAMGQASEVLYAFVATTGSPTLSLPTGGFGIRNGGASTSGAGGSKANIAAGLDKLVDVAETPTAGGTLSATRAWGVIIAGFKVNAGPPPTVTTNAATNVTDTTATLNGSANPNGAATTGYFRYVTTNPGTCNDTFGTRAPATGGSALGSGTSSVAYSQGITGLTASTTYYFCAIANNSQGTGFGSVLSLTTLATAATVDAFGTTYSSKSGLDTTSTAGQLSLISGNASGTLDSVTLDTKAVNGAGYESLLWNGTKPAGTRVQFWLATSNASGGPWTFYDANCFANGSAPYEPATGATTAIGCTSTHWNKRYFRYRVKLCFDTTCTATSGTSPTVQDITIVWSK